MATVIIIIVIVAVFAIYGGLTFPQTVVTVPVSFTAGTDVTSTTFTQSTLDRMAQVQVSVQNGVALWRARILNGDTVVWEHSAGLGEQQSYDSGWIPLAEGTYNFTFGVIGGGSLQATATLSVKGGFW